MNETVYEQTAFLDRVDQITTAIMISSGVVTFPPALFVYVRVLTMPDFSKEYLVKLFVLNGFSNFIIYMVNIVEIQFVNWPSTYLIYKWLSSTPIPLFVRFLQGFSYSLMWQTTFFISLNRYLSIRFHRAMKRKARKYFLLATFCSSILAVIVSFPLFFSGFSYAEIEIEDEMLAHYPIYKEGHEYLEIPSAYHQNFISLFTLIVNVMIVFKFKNLRQDIGENTKLKGKPEHGLLICSILMFLVHLSQTVILAVTQFAPDPNLSLAIPLFITVATTVPFWTLIGFAHSLRRAVLSGTPLNRREQMVISFSSKVSII